MLNFTLVHFVHKFLTEEVRRNPSEMSFIHNEVIYNSTVIKFSEYITMSTCQLVNLLNS